jgi:hypothetical protein
VNGEDNFCFSPSNVHYSPSTTFSPSTVPKGIASIAIACLPPILTSFPNSVRTSQNLVPKLCLGTPCRQTLFGTRLTNHKRVCHLLTETEFRRNAFPNGVWERGVDVAKAGQGLFQTGEQFLHLAGRVFVVLLQSDRDSLL